MFNTEQAVVAKIRTESIRNLLKYQWQISVSFSYETMKNVSEKAISG